MTRDEIIRNMAEVLAGLQVPISMRMPLGTATSPWHALFGELHGFGWTDADQIEAALQERLATK